MIRAIAEKISRFLKRRSERRFFKAAESMLLRHGWKKVDGEFIFETGDGVSSFRLKTDLKHAIPAFLVGRRR